MGGESKPNPFVADSTVPAASVGYRYRKWTIGDHVLVARTEVDGVLDDKGTDSLILVKALNEFDTKAVDWRKKVSTILSFLFFSFPRRMLSMVKSGMEEKAVECNYEAGGIEPDV